jgi:uncharacterized protein YjdB
MKKALFGILACLALFGLVLTGCEDLLNMVNGPKVAGVSLDQQTLLLPVDDEGQLTATINPSDAERKGVTWTSSDSTVATVSRTGLVTGKKAGTATITVTTDDGGFTAFCTVTVTAAGLTAVTDVTLDQSNLTIGIGKEKKLTATIAPWDAANKAVTWTSSNETIATVDGGVITGVGVGTATITVTTADGNETAFCTVTVTAGGGGDALGTNTPDTVEPVTGVKLDKTTLPLTVNERGLLTATITPLDAANQGVTWTSSDSTIATVTGGIVTGKKAGTATIIVTTADGGKTDYCTVTVTAPSAGGDEKPSETRATITVTGIRANLNAKTYLAALFPAGTTSADMMSKVSPLAYGQGTISGTTAAIALFSADSSNPWNAANGSYVLGLSIGDGLSLDQLDKIDYGSLAYAGMGTVTLTSQKATIAFANLDEGTPSGTGDNEEKPSTGGEEPGGNEPGEPGETQAAITVTGIRTDLAGKEYMVGLFPNETKLEDIFTSNPLAYGRGTISGTTAAIALFSADDGESWNASNGSYVVGIFIGTASDSGSEGIDYAGYGTVTLTSQKGTIAFSALTDATDSIPKYPSTGGEEKPGETQATITVTGIRTDLAGKEYMVGLFPNETPVEDMFTSNPLAYGRGIISKTTADIDLFSTDNGEPWDASNGSYALGFLIEDEAGAGVAYAGFGTVTFTSQKATIDFSKLTDATDKILSGEIPIPNESGNDDEEKPGTGGDPTGNDKGELADATNWDEQKWSSWFAAHPASDSMNALAMLEFMSANSYWIADNYWWYSHYTAWGTGTGGGDHGEFGPRQVFSRLRKQWIRN